MDGLGPGKASCSAITLAPGKATISFFDRNPAAGIGLQHLARTQGNRPYEPSKIQVKEFPVWRPAHSRCLRALGHVRAADTTSADQDGGTAVHSVNHYRHRHVARTLRHYPLAVRGNTEFTAGTHYFLQLAAVFS